MPQNDDLPAPAFFFETLLERVDRLAGTGRAQLNLGSGKLSWSENLYRLFGVDPAAWQPTPQAVLARAHPDDREHLSDRLSSLLDDVPVPPLEFRIVRPDGRLSYLRAPASEEMLRDEHGPQLTSVVRDVSEKRRVDRELAARGAVSAVLATWTSFDECAPRLLRELTEALGLSVGIIWVPRRDVLIPASLWLAGAIRGTEFDAATRGLRLPRGIGLPGLAWQRKRSVDATATASERGDPRALAVARAELRTAAAIPLVWRDEALAVIELRSTELSEITERTMTAIGSEIGTFLARRRAELNPPALTAREHSVLLLAAQGLSAGEVAARLMITPATVRTHLAHIYAKLGVTSRTAAVAHALRSGLIE